MNQDQQTRKDLKEIQKREDKIMGVLNHLEEEQNSTQVNPKKNKLNISIKFITFLIFLATLSFVIFSFGSTIGISELHSLVEKTLESLLGLSSNYNPTSNFTGLLSLIITIQIFISIITLGFSYGISTETKKHSEVLIIGFLACLVPILTAAIGNTFGIFELSVTHSTLQFFPIFFMFTIGTTTLMIFLELISIIFLEDANEKFASFFKYYYIIYIPLMIVFIIIALITPSSEGLPQQTQIVQENSQTFMESITAPGGAFCPLANLGNPGYCYEPQTIQSEESQREKTELNFKGKEQRTVNIEYLQEFGELNFIYGINTQQEGFVVEKVECYIKYYGKEKILFDTLKGPGKVQSENSNGIIGVPIQTAGSNVDFDYPCDLNKAKVTASKLNKDNTKVSIQQMIYLKVPNKVSIRYPIVHLDSYYEANNLRTFSFATDELKEDLKTSIPTQISVSNKDILDIEIMERNNIGFPLIISNGNEIKTSTFDLIIKRQKYSSFGELYSVDFVSLVDPKSSQVNFPQTKNNTLYFFAESKEAEFKFELTPKEGIFGASHSISDFFTLNFNNYFKLTNSISFMIDTKGIDFDKIEKQANTQNQTSQNNETKIAQNEQGALPKEENKDDSKPIEETQIADNGGSLNPEEFGA